MTREQFLDFCRNMPGALVDQPFREDFETWIARHADTKKWFAAVLRHGGRDFVDLKCEPVEAEFLRSVFQGIAEGYHMNKRHWITVFFESDVPDDLLKQLTKNSYQLTEAKKKNG